MYPFCSHLATPEAFPKYDRDIWHRVRLCELCAPGFKGLEITCQRPRCGVTRRKSFYEIASRTPHLMLVTLADFRERGVCAKCRARHPNVMLLDHWPGAPMGD